MTLLFLLCLVILSCVVAYPVNVHIVGHSHDDPGWLKTADQYYSGTNNTIYNAAVHYIFESVIGELQKDSSRTFSMCEISFLSRWWDTITEDKKNVVRNLIQNKQLVVLNGGWVMHDEATTHYVSMIDQTTLGHAFLKQELNYEPKVGWQIDPFGHSSTHAWMSYEFGFDALYFGRIDYQDHDLRMDEKRMEIVWKGSSSQCDANLFTGMFTSGNYCSPSGMCFDRVLCNDEPVVDDENLETYNLDSKMAMMVDAIEYEIAHAIGNNVMIKMGADFTFVAAASWYDSMDILIKRINERYPDKYNMIYSTPEKYTEYRATENIQWTDKTDDFFPYSDCPHCFWTGYFTSRPTLKYLERRSSGFLQAMRQVSVHDKSESTTNAALDLTAAVGLINHHDAITGTSKQHVADDYFKILSKALSKAETALLQQIAPKVSENQFQLCRSYNESYCAISQSVNDGGLDVLIYNPLPRQESQTVKVFISQKYASVQIAESVQYVDASIFATFKGNNAPNKNQAPYTLVFNAADISGLSSKQFHVNVYSSKPSDSNIRLAQFADEVSYSSQALSVQTKTFKLDFGADGLLSNIARYDGGNTITASLANNIRYYTSFGPPRYSADAIADGTVKPQEETCTIDTRDPTLKHVQPFPEFTSTDVSSQRSGAYIFRTTTSDEIPKPITPSVKLSVVQTSDVTEVRQIFSDYATQAVRISDTSNVIEFEWTIGPIPIDDGLGKEYICRYESDLFTGNNDANEVYTDSNGREFLQRKYNYRPTWDMEVFEDVAGNFYPITTGMYLKDTNNNKQLSILTDRAQSGASLASGELELMVHRRILNDDGRGVDEALDETTEPIGPYPNWIRTGDGITVRGKHWVLLSNLEDGMKEVRYQMDKMYSQFELMYNVNNANSNNLYFLGNGLGMDLPINVQLMSLYRLSNKPNTLLFRLAHQFANNEDSSYSQPVSVNLAQVLKSFNYVEGTLEELNLSGNQIRSEMISKKTAWKSPNTYGNCDVNDIKNSNDINSMIITLTPMEIKTFTIEITDSSVNANNVVDTSFTNNNDSSKLLIASLCIVVLLIAVPVGIFVSKYYTSKAENIVSQPLLDTKINHF